MFKKADSQELDKIKDIIIEDVLEDESL